MSLGGPTIRQSAGQSGDESDEGDTSGCADAQAALQEAFRVLRDSAYGTLSSDGRSVFSLEDVGYPSDLIDPSPGNVAG